MAINLKKGEKLNLAKVAPGLRKVRACCGWDANAFTTGAKFDLDLSAFPSDDAGVCHEEDVIFYNTVTRIDENGQVMQDPDHRRRDLRPCNKNMSIYHTGDNRTGDGEGDDEQIFVDLENVPANIAKIAFTVTIDEAEERGQNFGQVSNAYIRLVNDETGEEILRFDLNEDFSIETAVVFAELYRKDGEWRFNAVGSGFQDGLAGICNYYNLATEG
jgi:tellurium resistance protein TerD